VSRWLHAFDFLTPQLEHLAVQTKIEEKEWSPTNVAFVDCEAIFGETVPRDWNNKVPTYSETARPA